MIKKIKDLSAGALALPQYHFLVEAAHAADAADDRWAKAKLKEIALSNSKTGEYTYRLTTVSEKDRDIQSW